MYQAGCRFFNGYKPCHKNSECSKDCPHLDIPKQSILIVHLGAMGAVLRSTALLTMIKRKYPSSYITWVTEDHSKPLLAHNPYIDRVLGISTRDQLILSAMNFDVGFFIDKSPEVAGLRKIANPKSSFGFSTAGLLGAIHPLNASAIPLWELGLNNQKKFFENKKTELQLIAEALEVPYQRDDYVLHLTNDEISSARKKAAEWSDNGRFTLVGLNTGTSGVLPHKTIPVEVWRRFIGVCSKHENWRLVLLGGPDDENRNRRISEGLSVIQSSTQRGLRDGLTSVMAVDVVITGDSLGLHMAIACKKPVVAWFGPTCAHEIDLYDRGIKITSDLTCSPCWKRSCNETIPCCDRIDVRQFESAIEVLLGRSAGSLIRDRVFSV